MIRGQAAPLLEQTHRHLRAERSEQKQRRHKKNAGQTDCDAGEPKRMVAAGIQEGGRRTGGQKAFDPENGRNQQKTKIRRRQQQKRKTVGARDAQLRQQAAVQRPTRAAAAQKGKNRI